MGIHFTKAKEFAQGHMRLTALILGFTTIYAFMAYRRYKASFEVFTQIDTNCKTNKLQLFVRLIETRECGEHPLTLPDGHSEIAKHY